MNQEKNHKLPVSTVKQLITETLTGNMEAFETLFASAEHLLYRMGLGITGDPQDAEEALAETALSVLEALPTLRRPEYFYTWATRIMINACHAIGRQQSKVVPISKPEPSLSERYPGDSPWADLQDVREALQALSDEHRTVIVLRYIEDLSVEEAADLLGIPEGTVKSRLHYGLTKLRAKLGTSHSDTRAGGAKGE